MGGTCSNHEAEHEVIDEKLRVGELRMNKHSEKLDKILIEIGDIKGCFMKKTNQVLLLMLACALGFAGTVYIASGKPDPAIERIEKLLVQQIGRTETIATIIDRVEK